MIVEKILGKIEDFPIESLKINRILMDHYELTKSHQKVTSEEGDTYGISLPRGKNLSCGDVIYMDDEKIVVIDLIPEDIIEVHPKGNIQWGKAAFNIGNMHQKAYLREDCILVPYDANMENIIKGLGIEYNKCKKKLDGIRANYSGEAL